MKTIEEFINEIESSEALQNELKAIQDKDGFEVLLKKHDCGFTAEEYAEFVKSQFDEALSDDEAENAAGGAWWSKKTPVSKKSSITGSTDPVPLVKSIISVYYCDNPDCSQYNINCGYVTGTAPGCPVCSGRLSMR